MQPLDDLQLFAAVARLRSFRRAAEELRLSPSGLSERIAALEARMGVRLLNRTTRSVSATEAGRVLLERLLPALETVESAVADARDVAGAASGALRINAPPPAIELALAPLVGPFLREHPQVRLEVIADSALVDIVGEGFDAGVRWGEDLHQDMIAVPLGPPQEYVLVASPAFLEAHGAPERPEDVLCLPCIRARYPDGRTPPLEFERDGRGWTLDPDGPLLTTSIPLQRRACLDSAGLWFTFDGYAAEDLAAGRLVSVLDAWRPRFPGPFLYYPRGRHMRGALRAFVDFARARVRAAPATASGAAAG